MKTIIEQTDFKILNKEQLIDIFKNICSDHIKQLRDELNIVKKYATHIYQSRTYYKNNRDKFKQYHINYINKQVQKVVKKEESPLDTVILLNQ